MTVLEYLQTHQPSLTVLGVLIGIALALWMEK